MNGILYNIDTYTAYSSHNQLTVYILHFINNIDVQILNNLIAD